MSIRSKRICERFWKVPSVHEKVEWVRRRRQDLGSVREGCEMMELNASTYYYRPKVSRAERDKRDADLRERMAVALRNPVAGIIHHSDRKVQYARREYVAELERHGFTVSMSSPGNAYDNAFAESFMKTLKQEEVHLWEYESFTEVVERIPLFIETAYNRKRVHSGTGYLPSEEFEAILQDEDRKQELGQVTLKLAD